MPALLAALTLAAPGAARAADASSASLRLSPAHAQGVAQAGATVGPFKLVDGSDADVDVTVAPLRARQRRDGSLSARGDASDRAQVDGPTEFHLSAGGGYQILNVRLLPAAAERGFYGVVRFTATPVDGGEPVTLDAGFDLDPQRGSRDVAVRAVAVRARDDRDLAVVVRNRGNVAVTPLGTIAVREPNGHEAALATVRSVRILPGAVVRLDAPLSTVLTPGGYRADASLTAGGKDLDASGTFEVASDGSVHTTSAAAQGADAGTTGGSGAQAARSRHGDGGVDAVVIGLIAAAIAGALLAAMGFYRRRGDGAGWAPEALPLDPGGRAEEGARADAASATAGDGAVAGEADTGEIDAIPADAVENEAGATADRPGHPGAATVLGIVPAPGSRGAESAAAHTPPDRLAGTGAGGGGGVPRGAAAAIPSAVARMRRRPRALAAGGAALGLLALRALRRR